MHERMPGWWSTRILLVIGGVATGLVVVGAFVGLIPPPMFDPRTSVFGLPAGVVIPGLSVAPALVGFAWQLRVFRGPRDEPPAWRHRDR